MAVPPDVVTVTVTAPAECAGATTASDVPLLVPSVAAVLPKVTEVAPLRFVPLIVTKLPPATGPCAGEIPLIVGAVASNVYEVVAVPPGVVTVTMTGPGECAGTVTASEVPLFVPRVAAVLPNVTEVAPVRFVPVMVALLPPVAGPWVGEMLVIVGCGGATVTVTCRVQGALFAVFVELSVYVVVDGGETLFDPFCGCVPIPLSMTGMAVPRSDQLSVEDAPDEIDAGAAENEAIHPACQSADLLN